MYSRLKAAVVLLFLLGIAAAPAASSDGKRLPIMTWSGPDASLLTPEVYKGIADAGFSVNLSFYGDPTVNKRALDLAAASGLKLMVHDARVSKLIEDESLPLDALESVVRDYARHPALFGYYIVDEPGAGKFARIAAIMRRLEALDPRHPAYVNLFPTYANEQQLGVPTYEEHVARYLETVRPPFISYDHYPVTTDGLRPDYYRNLEIIRGAALEKGLDFWAFTLATAHAIYPVATAAHLRLQLFSDLAYGAKGLQYFTYATPQGTDFDWGYGLIGKDGKPSAAYELARTVNAEVRRIEDLVMRWKSLSVEHSAPVPEGAKAVGGEGTVAAVEGAPLVVGTLEDGNARYVMLVNRDYERSRTAIVRFAAGVKGLREISKDDRPPVRLSWPSGADERVCALEFAPGDARIFRLELSKQPDK